MAGTTKEQEVIRRGSCAFSKDLLRNVFFPSSLRLPLAYFSTFLRLVNELVRLNNTLCDAPPAVARKGD